MISCRVVSSVAAIAASVIVPSLRAQPGSFAGPVPVERLSARRQALADKIGVGIAVLAAAPERDEDGRDHPQDNFYRQDNDFFYLTGLETPKSWLVIVARDSAPDETILFIPPRDTLKERWWGPQLVPGPEVQQLTGITDVRPSVDAAGEIMRLVRAGGSPARRGTLMIKRTPEWLRNSVLRELSEIPDLRLEDVSRAIASMRLVTDNRGQLEDGDVVVMDMAAEHGYYKSDVTRTIPANGRFTARQRAIYDLVLGAQQAAIDSVRPGTTIGRLNAIARQYMRANSGSLCGGSSCDQYFVHGLSHWLGMDTHDVGPYNVPLQAGMVFSVEPGLTMAAEGFRIGIEDVVLVTETGGENLSAKLPRKPDEIEAYMRRNRSRD